MSQPDHVCKCGRAFHTGGKAGRFWCATCLEYVFIAIDQAAFEARQAEQHKKARQRAEKLKLSFAVLKRFRTQEDRGLGDTVERLVARIGGRPLRRFKTLMDNLSIDCGCTSRRDWLNSLVPYD
jgi:hypothetical protein